VLRILPPLILAMRPSEASRRPQHHHQEKPAESSREVVLAPPPAPKEKSGGGGGSLIEFSTIAGEDPNADVAFGEVPAHCKCPHCDRQVITFIDYEASWITYLLAFVVWVSLGWMALWVLPLLWPAFKDVVHRCPRCLNIIERKSRINLPTFKTEIMTCKVGNCAVVLSRKYVAILLGVIGLIVSFYFLRSTIQMNTAHEEHKGEPSMLTWEDFIFDCGPKSQQLSHHVSSAKAFEERYRKRSFKWQGEVKIIREGFNIMMMKTKSVMMVQMYPSRYKIRYGEHPDIALLFGDEHFHEVAELMPGDWIQFEATMSAHGFRGDPEVMVLWHVEKADKPHPLLSTPHKHEDLETGDDGEHLDDHQHADHYKKHAGTAAEHPGVAKQDQQQEKQQKQQQQQQQEEKQQEGQEEVSMKAGSDPADEPDLHE